jgi:hypothetical protein
VGAEAGDCRDNGRSDAETEAAARREQRRGGGSLVGSGGRVMSKGGASLRVEAAGQRDGIGAR